MKQLQQINNHLSWFSTLNAQLDAGEKPIIPDLSSLITKDTFNKVASFLSTALSGKTKNFTYNCNITYHEINKDNFLKDNKCSAYFIITSCQDKKLECEIVLSAQDTQTNWTIELDNLLHEYGHYRSLIDYCIENNPRLELPMKTKSGFVYTEWKEEDDTCFDKYWNDYLVNEARMIFKEEVLACFNAFQTIDLLPLSSQKKFAVQNYMQTGTICTLQYYANNVEKLIEKENKPDAHN